MLDRDEGLAAVAQLAHPEFLGKRSLAGFSTRVVADGGLLAFAEAAVSEGAARA
jgi:hypothetical protein